MKKMFYLIMISLFVISCAPQNKIADTKENHEIKPTKNDDGEWELDVLDTQYDYFLTAIAKPMSMYSESYLKSRNTFLVTEWNSYYFSGRYRNVIESSIDYNSNENYGIKFEYRLYQVFAYVQWKYGLKMNGLSQSDIR
ncbi:hypothetical protein SAMN05421876_102274 [Kaistella jeonii]|uniref:Lipoprotein n=2 Tax=Kaistella jeonii TaxID=266749 RepID=A0A0C1D7W5_9FLAO|nr:hypothetical protein OA86_05100 [Kaistella jeonii]SFB79879.1 hypothetical protein SAMN05421876_102274 [Kaistella jeonii]VEI96239.1 Uncharacterised protein [Kaistella jeonii]